MNANTTNSLAIITVSSIDTNNDYDIESIIFVAIIVNNQENGESCSDSIYWMFIKWLSLEDKQPTAPNPLILLVLLSSLSFFLACPPPLPFLLPQYAFFSHFLSLFLLLLYFFLIRFILSPLLPPSLPPHLLSIFAFAPSLSSVQIPQVLWHKKKKYIITAAPSFREILVILSVNCPYVRLVVIGSLLPTSSEYGWCWVKTLYTCYYSQSLY